MEELADLIRPGTKRGLDFVILEELRKRTGIMPNEVLKFAMAEMLCNALDTDATVFDVVVKNEDSYAELIVRDNGTAALSLEDIKLILDFENKASSKRGFLRVSRGYLGNALKCIFGYCHALAIEKGLVPPSIVIENGHNRYTIDLRPDRIREVIESDIRESESENPGHTTFIVKIPHNPEHDNISTLRDIILATGMVNPDRQIHYSFFGVEEGVQGSAIEDAKAAKQQTSVLWYGPKQFETLFADFLRARPDIRLKEFIALFRGLTGKKIIREILQKLSSGGNHDYQDENTVQFFPATPIQDLSQKDITQLFHTMRGLARPVGKRSISSVLGCVGEEAFERLRESRGWARLRYTKIPAFRVEGKTGPKFPYLIELAVFDRDDDGEGLKVFQCVNFMASMEDIFSRIFRISYRLGQVGITKDMPVTVLLHLVCPVLNWLNYGKSGLDE